MRAYEHGRYPEAMDELRAVEADASGGGATSATRYALYRGLAHLALGDFARRAPGSSASAKRRSSTPRALPR